MTSEDKITVVMSRRESWFMKQILQKIVDDNVYDRGNRDYRALDMCSRLNKRLEDAMKGANQ